MPRTKQGARQSTGGIVPHASFLANSYIESACDKTSDLGKGDNSYNANDDMVEPAKNDVNADSAQGDTVDAVESVVNHTSNASSAGDSDDHEVSSI
jgi:hypothetical protein